MAIGWYDAVFGPITVGERIKRVRQYLDDLEKYVPPDLMIDVLESYVESAKGRIIKAEIEAGTYGASKYHAGEHYD